MTHSVERNTKQNLNMNAGLLIKISSIKIQDKTKSCGCNTRLFYWALNLPLQFNVVKYSCNKRQYTKKYTE